MKWKIGNVEIDNQVVLAPMSRECNSSFRRIAKLMGCGLVETEMISATAIKYNNHRTQEMLYMTDYEDLYQYSYLDLTANHLELLLDMFMIK